MGKRKMANKIKSGIRIWAAALVLLCTGMAGQVQAAGLGDTQAAGTAAPGAAAPGTMAPDAAAPAPGTMAPDTAAPGPQAANAPGSGAGRAEAGIIEVESGYVDAKGKFWKMKSGSGFLIANKESATYIVTNCSTVSNTPQKIKKFCKKNKIDTENTQITNSIRVIVTGDVAAAAEVVVKSAEKDYCVLSAANVVSQKESLKLGDSAGIAANDVVYAYGFPKDAGTGDDALHYSEMDVRAIQGAITQAEAYLEGGVYLAHSAPVVPGCEGGPLLDADGYVVGLNCKKSQEDDTGIAYALPINEICAVLDNFSIYYGSRAIDAAFVQLEGIYQECAGLQEAGGYKRATMEALEQALEQVEEVRTLEEPSVSDLTNAFNMLAAARDGLVPKTEPITIAIMVLAPCDLLLFIWMLVLAVKNAREKKWMELQRMQPAIQSAASQAGMRQPSGNAGYPGRAPQQNAAYPGPGRQAPQQAAGYQGQHGQESYRQPVVPPAGRRLRMIRQKTGQTVVLNKNQFIIGKSQTLADFCIADNQTVSRKHAMLFEENGGWYIDDLNSLNGTCVNGTKVVPGQAVKLNGGDEITMSDEAFLVQE